VGTTDSSRVERISPLFDWLRVYVTQSAAAQNPSESASAHSIISRPNAASNSARNSSSAPTSGAAIYQLGTFGTAQKKLKLLPLRR
jgi:hypothetical protein